MSDLRRLVNLAFLLRDWTPCKGAPMFMYKPLSKLYTKSDMLVKIESLLKQERENDEQADRRRENDLRRSSGKDVKADEPPPIKDDLFGGIFGRDKRENKPDRE